MGHPLPPEVLEQLGLDPCPPCEPHRLATGPYEHPHDQEDLEALAFDEGTDAARPADELRGSHDPRRREFERTCQTPRDPRQRRRGLLGAAAYLIPYNPSSVQHVR
ncbi:MAG: hypothetical protein ACRDPC_13740 [Solirubrobacteraceae bacterium]